MAFQRKEDLLEMAAQVLANHPIIAAYLYGSTAANRATLLSDIDIAVLLSDAAFDPQSRLRFELALEEELARNGMNRADVRIINDAPIMIQGEVLTNGQLLVSQDDPARVDFETRTRMEYFDFQPLADEIARAYLRLISQRGFRGQPAKD